MNYSFELILLSESQIKLIELIQGFGSQDISSCKQITS